MTQEQINKINQSFSHSDSIVIQVGDKIYVADDLIKRRKYGEIQFKDCSEINESCFESNGEYYGDVCGGPLVDIYLDDPYADEPNEVATVYYQDELREVITQ